MDRLGSRVLKKILRREVWISVFEIRCFEESKLPISPLRHSKTRVGCCLRLSVSPPQKPHPIASEPGSQSHTSYASFLRVAFGVNSIACGAPRTRCSHTCITLMVPSCNLAYVGSSGTLCTAVLIGPETDGNRLSALDADTASAARRKLTGNRESRASHIRSCSIWKACGGFSV